MGVNMAEFVKQFNDRTSAYVPNIPLPVKLTSYSDRTFKFDVRTPPTSTLVKMATGLDKGSTAPGSLRVGYITPEAVLEIAKVKVLDEANADTPLKGMCKTVVGTCRSMGVEIREAEES